MFSQIQLFCSTSDASAEFSQDSFATLDYAKEKSINDSTIEAC